ncbi:hypothetical protein JXD20_00595 [Candidatus Peregrinibacteria bacterium]|nr:hypothetical protein [Candidatus Peregrinibacteria bacterium]
MKSKVLLTSEFPQSESPVLATILHDANNILIPIMLGITERKENLDEADYAARMQVAEDIRKRAFELCCGAKNGKIDPDQFSQFFQETHTKLKQFLHSFPPNGTHEYHIEYAEMKRQLEEFCCLMEQGEQYLNTHSIEENSELGDFSALVEEIVTSYERRYPHVRFESHIDCDDCIANFRPTCIRRALENLMTNAVQALPETGGAVTVSLHLTAYGPDDRPFVEIEEGTYISLEIEDNGSGIPEHIMGSLPKRMFSTKKGGQGLGLASARDSLLSHKGHLLVESEFGKGTRITALFPSSFPPPPPESDPGLSVGGDRPSAY